MLAHLVPILFKMKAASASVTLAADTFNRADSGTLGTSSGGQTWLDDLEGSAQGPFGITSNQCLATNVNSTAFEVIDIGVGVGFTVSCDVTPNADGATITFRSNQQYGNSGTARLMGLRILSGNATLWKNTAGGGGETAIAGPSAWPGGRVSIVVDASSNIVVKGGSTTVFTVTDAALNTNTKVGLRTDFTSGSKSVFDNFLVTTP